MAVLNVITRHLGDPNLLQFLNLYCHAESVYDAGEKAYDVSCKREGPALNISISKSNTNAKIPFIKNYSQNQSKILDADFTLALRCPKFPQDGKCEYCNTRRCFDVGSTSFERCGRQMDVETTL